MSFKDSKIYSIVALTCPRCYKGRLFKNKSSYSRGMAEINKTCSVCGEDFIREPGFYFGAAYVSYALTVALWIALFVALTVFDAIGIMRFSLSNDTIFFLILGVVVLLISIPFMYRLSRSLWIHMFVQYRDDAIEFNRQKACEKAARKEALHGKSSGNNPSIH